MSPQTHSHHIMYVGPLNPGGTCLQRLRDLQSLGHLITPIDTRPSDVVTKLKTLPIALAQRLVGPLDLASANRSLLELSGEVALDTIWIDKGLTIKRNTLERMKSTNPKIFIVSYSPDDMM